jgi:very-short-patch-repair endonuclease
MEFRPKASLGGLSRRTRKGQARALRAAPTDAEARFWSIVRSGRIDGLRFRRQHQIGTWIVDFYCHELGLVVELAGSVHDNAEVQARDAKRQADLEAKGFQVLEFVNEVVLNSPRDTEAELRTFIAKIPSKLPALPPAGGAGRVSGLRGVRRGTPEAPF